MYYTYNMCYTFGEKFANFNEFYNGYRLQNNYGIKKQLHVQWPSTTCCLYAELEIHDFSSSWKIVLTPIKLAHFHVSEP